MKEKLITNITLQKLVKRNKEKLQKNDFLSVSSMSTEHMQLSETESSHEFEQLQNSAAESKIVEDDISKNKKK